MKIAIDLSPLQNAHRMRGIGFTLLNFINNLPANKRSRNQFIFYVLPKTEALFKNPFELLNVEEIDYQVRELKSIRQIRFRIPGLAGLPIRVVNRFMRIKAAHLGSSRIAGLDGVDILLQADQNQLLPKGNRKIKKVLIVYDLIPYVLESDYLWTYKTARLRGCSRKGALRSQILRRLYARKMRVNAKRADKLLAISEQTKKDFVNLLSVSGKKIVVTPLGVSEPVDVGKKPPKLEQYYKTGWGYVSRPLSLDPAIPFLLYVGGADSRRKLEDLVAAFNNIRAQGKKLKLVLAGDILLGPKAVTTTKASKALRQSSYIDDIVFMGFVDNQTRDWLYANAAVFVFPSKYEGFGLPVLEAMAHGSPVICYKNQAIEEVAGHAPIYVNDLEGMISSINSVLSYSAARLNDLGEKGLAQSQKFTWANTAKSIMSIIDTLP